MSLILDGKKLEEFGQVVWGSGWKTKLAERLSRSRETVRMKCTSKTGLNRRWKRMLLAVFEDQMVATAAIVEELRRDLEQP